MALHLAQATRGLGAGCATITGTALGGRMSKLALGSLAPDAPNPPARAFGRLWRGRSGSTGSADIGHVTAGPGIQIPIMLAQSDGGRLARWRVQSCNDYVPGAEHDLDSPGEIGIELWAVEGCCQAGSHSSSARSPGQHRGIIGDRSLQAFCDGPASSVEGARAPSTGLSLLHAACGINALFVERRQNRR